MKTRQIYCTTVLLIISITVHPQLKVSSTGKVGINLGTSTPLSSLSIGGIGSTSYQAYIGFTGYNTLLKVEKTSPSGSGMIRFILVITDLPLTLE
ncbi:MAG: hypothetical protein LWW91_01500 [Bacteroidales bacterium]|nr:hypothetical protein [Bacteroidales bacterium]